MRELKSILDCTLATLYTRSRLLYVHSRETADISCSIGRLLDLSSEELTLLEVAGIFHDIGKLAILPEILQKPGELTSREKELIHAHPAWGVEYIKGTAPNVIPVSNGVPYLVTRFGDKLIRMVIMHHEEPDGTGYPNRKKLDDIDLHTRILIIADRFQAMTTDRSYKKAYDPELVVNSILDHLLMTFFPDDSEAIAERLLKGQLDYARSDNEESNI